MKKTRTRKYFALGVFLLSAYLAQALFHLKMPWLESLQQDQTYKITTGLVLLAFVGFQWLLTIFRMKGYKFLAHHHYNYHKQLGCFAPLIFYIHSTQLGYAYLALLSSVYLANTAVGLFNYETLRISRKSFVHYWMVTHVALSLLVVVLIIYHIFIVFAYE